MCDGFDKVGQVTTGNSPTARPWAAPALWVAVVVLLLIAAACGSTSKRLLPRQCFGNRHLTSS